MSGTAGEISNSHDYRQGENLPREPHDWYVEDQWCSDLLLESEWFGSTMLDPCAGMGRTLLAWAEHMAKHPYSVGGCYGTDLIERGYPGIVGDMDFLAADYCDRVYDLSGGRRFDTIMFNPPYKDRLPVDFILKALAIAQWKVAALVQTKFLYGATDTRGRYQFFQDTKPSAIYHLSSRPSMPPGSLLRAGAVTAKGGKTDYSWIVWTRGHRGPPLTYWLRRPDHAKPLRRKRPPHG